MTKEPKPDGIYRAILKHIFAENYTPGAEQVAFTRPEIFSAAHSLGRDLPKNAGDVVYNIRYRATMPPEIAAEAPEGKIWVIVGKGDAKYAFVAVDDRPLTPNPYMQVIKVPDSTPGIIARHVLSSEQALLAKVRYNRLIDLFTGIVCYSLQNHLRAKIDGIGQIETDEVYLGVDRSGVQYVIPVEAKGGNDKLSIVQMTQDLALAKQKFPGLEIRLVGAQFAGDDEVALFLFTEDPDSGFVKVVNERRYRLVDPGAITDAELLSYRATGQHE